MNYRRDSRLSNGTIRNPRRAWLLSALALLVMSCLPLPGAGGRATRAPAASSTPQPAQTATSIANLSPTLPLPTAAAPSPAPRTPTLPPTAAPPPTALPKPTEAFLPAGLEALSPANAPRLAQLKELEVKTGFDAVFSPDSSRVYIRYTTDANFRDGAVAAVDLKTGKVLFALALWAGKGIPELWVSKDGLKIATYKALTNSAQVWDALTGKALEEIKLTPGVHSFFLAPDWKAYAEVLPEADPLSLRVSLKELASQKELWKATLPGQPNPSRPTFSPDGAYLAFIRPLNQTVLSTILDAVTGKSVTLPNNVEFLSFSADGKLLLAKANERTLKLYESKTGAWKQDFSFPEQTITQAEFSPDGKLIAVYYNYARLQLLDAASGKAVFEKDARLWRAHFSPDGKLLLGIGDSFPRAVTLWGAAK